MVAYTTKQTSRKSAECNNEKYTECKHGDRVGQISAAYKVKFILENFQLMVKRITTKSSLTLPTSHMLPHSAY